MKFKQIADDFPIKNKDISFLYLVVTAVIFVTTLVWIQRKFQTPVIVLVSMILLSIFLMKRIRRLFPDWTREKDIIGEINFAQNAIILHQDDSIPYGDIQNIHFQYNYIKGHNFSYYDVIHNGLAALHITTKNDETKTIKFVMETKEQFDFLKPIFKKWYQSGITIKEEFGDLKHKTICLKVLAAMSYKEIQALKEEIKPHWKT